MRLEARDEENAFLGCNKRNFDLGGCNERRRVVRRGGAWVVTTGMFWVQTCFERKPHTALALQSRTNFLNHP